MDYNPLTKEQRAVLRLRAREWPQWQIAYYTELSPGNISAIERAALTNIVRAKNTLRFYYTLDARLLCTLKEGSDLFDGVSLIFEEAGKLDIRVNTDPVDLLNQLRGEFPIRIHGQNIEGDIEVYLREDGGLYFG